MTVIIFLIILAVLVLVHELGHFIIAKVSGIRVDEFGLGFPPKLFSKKIGSTLYTLNAIPFGGFVKIFGEDSHAKEIGSEERSGSFHYKPKWIKAIVLAGGVAFNIIFAWLLICLGFMIGFPTPADYQGEGQVTNVQTTIVEIVPNSPAQKAGLTTGDSLISIKGGKDILEGAKLTPENVSEFIGQHGNGDVEVVYKRGGSTEKTLSVTPQSGIVENKKAIGIAVDSVGILKLPLISAIKEGTRATYILTKQTVGGLLGFLKDVLTFKSSFSQISGPVGIAGVVGEASNLGFVYLISLVALISINLAVINLFPFPALDGGRLLFLFVEAIIRRPISAKFTQTANFVGFVFLILLMLVVTAHDIFKLF